jgi:hypothetical protein
MKKNLLFRSAHCLMLCLALLGCSRRVAILGDHFLKDGVPMPQLSAYRSPQLRPGQEAGWAIAAAVSGGGSRAAHHALGVLMGLESIALPGGGNVYEEIDYFAAVSGGGLTLGACFDLRFEGAAGLGASEADLCRRLDRSFYQPVLVAYLAPAVLAGPASSGDALSRSISRHLLLSESAEKRLRLSDIFVARADSLRPVRMPWLVANGTVLPSMAILPMAPDVLMRYGLSGFTEGHRLRRLPPAEAAWQMPLAHALGASGAFPPVIAPLLFPAGEKRWLRVYDGGVADNTGFWTAFFLLRQEPPTRRRLLLMIDADHSGDAQAYSSRHGASNPLSVSLGLPLSGLNAERVMRRQRIEALCEAEGIVPIFLSLYDLRPNPLPELPPSILLRQEQERMIALLADPAHAWTPEERAVLNVVCGAVATKYSIRPREQQVLVGAGRLLAQSKKQEILSALGL